MSIADVAALAGVPVLTARAFLAAWARQGAVEKIPQAGMTPLYRRVADELPLRSRDTAERLAVGIDAEDEAWMRKWATPRAQRLQSVECG